MIFTEDSMLVQLWVKWIKRGKYSETDVPKLSNLQEMVSVVLSV